MSHCACDNVADDLLRRGPVEPLQDIELMAIGQELVPGVTQEFPCQGTGRGTLAMAVKQTMEHLVTSGVIFI
jgi:hypothetical protein